MLCVLVRTWDPCFPLSKEGLDLFCCCYCSVFNCPTLVTSYTAARQASLSFTVSQTLLNLMSIESVIPFNHLILCHPLSSCPQSFPALASFSKSWLSTSGGQSTGASASVLPMNIQGWFPLGLSGLSLLSKELPRVFSSTTVWKHQFLGSQLSLWSNSHIHTWLLEKP